MNGNRDTEKQKKEENNLAWMIENQKDRRVFTMPEFSSIDFIIGKVDRGVGICTSIVEFRHRPDTSMTAWPDIYLNVSKVDKLIEMAEMMNGVAPRGPLVKPVFMVLWQEPVVMWLELNPPYPIKTDFERTESGRANDKKEPVYKIPISKFRKYMDYTPITVNP